jgi:hypothetical protein
LVLASLVRRKRLAGGWPESNIDGFGSTERQRRLLRLRPALKASRLDPIEALRDQ